MSITPLSRNTIPSESRMRASTRSCSSMMIRCLAMPRRSQCVSLITLAASPSVTKPRRFSSCSTDVFPEYGRPIRTTLRCGPDEIEGQLHARAMWGVVTRSAVTYNSIPIVYGSGINCVPRMARDWLVYTACRRDLTVFGRLRPGRQQPSLSTWSPIHRSWATSRMKVQWRTSITYANTLTRPVAMNAPYRELPGTRFLGSAYTIPARLPANTSTL